MNVSMRRATDWWLILIVFTIGVTTTLCSARDEITNWKQLSDRWYIFEITDSKAGWMHETVETDGKHYRTTTDTKLRFGRMDAETTIRITTTFIETLDGKPVSMSSSQDMSSQTVHASYVFTDEGVELTTKQGQREVTRSLPAPDGEWLTPHAVQEFLAKRHEARPDEFTYRSLDPSSGIEPISATSSFTREDTYQLGDREIPVTVWTTQTSVMPGDSIEMYSNDDVLVFWETDAGFGKMSMNLSTRTEAMADDGAPAPELLVSLFVHSNQPIPNPLRVRQLRFRLTAKDGKMIELPSTGAQRVVSTDDSSTMLIVDIDDNLPATEEEINSDDYRSASTMVGSDDPMIRKLTTRALRKISDSTDDHARAEQLRAFVYKHISDKGYETAFASASETARTRTGDCSEHGVLLAAMLRAANIPSRTATGLVYITEDNGKGLFGWHMWTQALIDGRWVDYDATLPTRYTAAHILTSTSALSDTSSNSELNSLLSLMGNLDIEVLEFTPASESVE